MKKIAQGVEGNYGASSLPDWSNSPSEKSRCDQLLTVIVTSRLVGLIYFINLKSRSYRQLPINKEVLLRPRVHELVKYFGNHHNK